jgi:hypothetical protein
MYSGALVGLAAVGLIDWSRVAFPLWLAAHLLGVAPTALQPLVQKKPFKAAARFLLGASSASYLVSGLFLQTYLVGNWTWRALVAGAFGAAFAGLQAWRRRRLDDPCATCPQGYFPTCDWNLPRLLRENSADEVLRDIRPRGNAPG